MSKEERAKENSAIHAYPLEIKDLWFNKGVTKREYFAGLAMQGMFPCQVKNDGWEAKMAKVAVKCADALLLALEDDNE